MNCSHTVAASKPVCAYCGWDERKGLPKRLKQMEEAPKPVCSKCGYDLRGLETPVCPECGTRNRLTSRGTALEIASQEIARWAYLRPALMLVCGMLVLLLFEGWQGQWDPWLLVFTVVSFMINTGVLTGVYVLCALGWIGLDMPTHLAVLRLAGVLAVTSVIYAVIALAPVPVLAVGLSGFAFVWMLHLEMDLELQDAVIVAILAAGAGGVVWVMGTLKLAGLMGLSL